MSNLIAQRRTLIGKNACKQLRKTGMIPAIIYGHKKEVYAIEVKKEDFATLLNKNEKIFHLTFADGAYEDVIIKEIHYDVWGEKILHIDFYRIDLNATVNIAVPIHFIGVPKGTANGGVWEKTLQKLEVTCLPIHIPERISVNVEKLDIGMHIRVRDLQIPAELTVTHDLDAIVTTVHTHKNDAEENAAEAAAASSTEPERIKKAKETEDPQEK